MKKLLAANRSEIAVRILGGPELGCRTVALMLTKIASAFMIKLMKAAARGKGPVAAYLDIDTIIEIAEDSDVELIHPGMVRPKTRISHRHARQWHHIRRPQSQATQANGR